MSEGGELMSPMSEGGELRSPMSEGGELRSSVRGRRTKVICLREEN